jgi:hypothetical protein
MPKRVHRPSSETPAESAGITLHTMPRTVRAGIKHRNDLAAYRHQAKRCDGVISENSPGTLRFRNRQPPVKATQNAHKTPYLKGYYQFDKNHCCLPRASTCILASLAQHARPPNHWLTGTKNAEQSVNYFQ